VRLTRTPFRAQSGLLAQLEAWQTQQQEQDVELMLIRKERTVWEQFRLVSSSASSRQG